MNQHKNNNNNNNSINWRIVGRPLQFTAIYYGYYNLQSMQ